MNIIEREVCAALAMEHAIAYRRAGERFKRVNDQMMAQLASVRAETLEGFAIYLRSTFTPEALQVEGRGNREASE